MHSEDGPYDYDTIGQLIASCPIYQQIKPHVVLRTYAIVHPLTMVIELLDATVADFTVFRFLEDIALTNIAEEVCLVKIGTFDSLIVLLLHSHSCLESYRIYRITQTNFDVVSDNVHCTQKQSSTCYNLDMNLTIQLGTLCEVLVSMLRL